ncbi:glycosyltransferase [Lacrimispora sp.]|uniref:glycosyltransferase n=1 Tax=Lacrimispora sp. TaxID=2719234 RepID=UPI0028AC662D|nr:glycosyltransferase [Lacrimispora sp.]
MISVIMPVYNSEKYIDKAIESIVNQTFRDLELILIEDGSSDESAVRCLLWAERDARIRLIQNEENAGQGVSRNKGIESAKGEYIYFCDSDDYLESNMLEILLQKLEGVDAEVVCCDYWQYSWRSDSKKYAKELCACESVGDNEIIDLKSRKDMPNFFPCILWNKLYKKEIFNNLEIRFPEQKVYFEDFYLNCLVMYYGYRFLYIHTPLYHYIAVREEGGNSNDDTEKMANDLKYIFSLLNEYYKGLGHYEFYRHAFKLHAQASLGYHLSKKDMMNRAKKEQRIMYETNSFFEKTYGIPSSRKKIYAFGSFCIRKALQMTFWEFEHISYMSIASAVKKRGALPPEYIVGDNSYRTKILTTDICENIYNMLDEVNEEYLIIDLLDERFDIAEINGIAVTKSDFFDLYAKSNCVPYEMRRLNIEEWTKICGHFVDVIHTKFDSSKIIIVENTLSLGYGTYRLIRNYDNIEEIKATNSDLMEKVRILEGLCKNCNVIRIPEHLNYTFCKHNFGCHPYYHNYSWYRYVANKFTEIVKEG